MAVAQNMIERGVDPIFMLIECKTVYEEAAEKNRRLIHRQRLQPLHRLGLLQNSSASAVWWSGRWNGPVVARIHTVNILDDALGGGEAPLVGKGK